MNIWFDIGHPAQYNFYKNSIIHLSYNHKVYITAIERGRLIAIMQKELGYLEKCTITKIGKHAGTKFSVIYNLNILRFFQLLFFFIKNKPDISIGNGFLHGFVGMIFRKPRIMFGDDIERKLDVRLKQISSTEMYYANVDQGKLKIKTFNALKEWAYLSPKYFSQLLTGPNKKKPVRFRTGDLLQRDLEFLFLDAGFLSGEAAEVENPCPAHLSPLVDLNLFDKGGGNGKDTFHADVSGHLPDGKGFRIYRASSLDHHTTKLLDPLLVSFLDFIVDGNGIAGFELRKIFLRSECFFRHFH